MDEVEAPEVAEAEPVEAVESAEPEYSDIADDALYRLDENGDPIKGADLRNGWLRQSDYSRKTEELKRQRQEYEQQRQQLEEWARTYPQQVAQYYQQQYAQRQQAGQKPTDPLAEIWQRATEANGGIITVEEAKLLAQQMQNQLQQTGGQYGNVLKAVTMLNDRINQLATPVQELATSRAQSQLESRLNSFLDSNDIPASQRERVGNLLKQWEPTPEERRSGMSDEDVWDGMLKEMTSTAREIERARASSAAKNLGRKGGKAAPSGKVKPPQTVEEIVEATWSNK